MKAHREKINATRNPSHVRSINSLQSRLHKKIGRTNCSAVGVFEKRTIIVLRAESFNAEKTRVWARKSRTQVECHYRNNILREHASTTSKIGIL